MHTIHCFLVNQDEEGCPDQNALDRYLVEMTDENNWYQEMMSVTQDGRIDLLAPENDWRGRNELYKEFLDIPQEERWNRALDLAMECVLSEISYPFKNAKRPITKEDFQFRNLNDLSTRMRECIAGGAMHMEAYKILFMTSLLQQVENISMPPFTGVYPSPYSSICAVDLRDERVSENLAIIFVDIHT